jgi:hypothetical protein
MTGIRPDKIRDYDTDRKRVHGQGQDRTRTMIRQDCRSGTNRTPDKVRDRTKQDKVLDKIGQGQGIRQE